MEPKLFRNRMKWRRWLEENYDKKNEIWLVFYKVKARKNGRESVSYEEAVQEALCFGWIDSTVRRIDDEKHMQRFTPRHKKSIWSQSNKARIKNLVESGLMHESGLQAVETAQKNGSWNKLDGIEKENQVPGEFPLKIPEALLEALKKIPGAESRFNALAPSRKKQLLWWLATARKEETRAKKIIEILKTLQG